MQSISPIPFRTPYMIFDVVFLMNVTPRQNEHSLSTHHRQRLHSPIFDSVRRPTEWRDDVAEARKRDCEHASWRLYVRVPSYL